VEAKNFTIYVSTTSNNNSVPCGIGSSNALSCKNLTSALKSIPKYSTSIGDFAEIRFLSGSFEACSLAHKGLVTPAGARTITFLPNSASATVNIICSTPYAGRKAMFFSMNLNAITYIFKNLSFRSNSTSSGMSMIYTPPSIWNSLIVSNCKFIGNSTQNQQSLNGISYGDTNTVNSVYIANSLFDSLYTAIIIPSSLNSFQTINWTINVNSCTFQRMKKGAITVGRETAHRLFVNNSIFSSNSIVDISLSSGSLFFSGCTFVNSTGQALSVQKVEFIDIHNCSFVGVNGNVIQTGKSTIGDFYISDSAFIGCSEYVIDDFSYGIWHVSIVTVSQHLGTALFSGRRGSSFQIDNCTFIKSGEVYEGPYILSGGYILNISRSTVMGYLIADLSYSTLDFSVSISSSKFESISVTFGLIFSFYKTGSVSIHKSTFLDISGDCTSGGVIFLSGSSVTVTSSVFSDAALSFGSLIAVDESSTLSMVNCTFTNIYSESDGSLLRLMGASLANVDRCTFSHLLTSYNGGFAAIDGGSSITLSSSSFYNISAALSGGVLYMGDDFMVNVSSCSFVLCTSIVNGGVVSCTSTGVFSSLAIFDSVFNSCFSFGQGGSLFIDNLASLRISSSSFVNSSSVEEGGCVFSQTVESFLISSSLFSTCRSEFNGGALYLSYVFSPILMLSSFLDCSGFEGGAIFLDDNVGGVVLGGSSFSNNVAIAQGGAISAIGSYTSLNLSSSNFNFNTAMNGGAIFIFKSQLNVTGCQFLSNSAISSSASQCSDSKGSGGAIFFNDTLTPLKASLISISTFNSNRASFFGGGIGAVLVTNGSQVAFFLSKNSFLGCSASYGPNFGSPWTTFSASPFYTSFFLSDPGSILYSLKDFFNQTAMNLSCYAHFKLQASSPPGYFQLTGSDLIKISILDESSTADFQLRWFQDLLFVPGASVAVNISMLPCIQRDSSFVCSSMVDFQVKLCTDGYEVQRSGVPDQFFMCVPCVPGKYLNKDDCIDCQAGTFSGFGATSCEPCQPGFMIDAQRTSCYLCSPGSFTTTQASTTCAACPFGTFAETLGSTTCTICPKRGTTLNIGAMSEFECVCPNGTSGAPSQGVECRTCLDLTRTACPANSTIPFINPGYWRSSRDPTVALECVPKEACFDTQMNMMTTCTPSYTGTLCGACASSDYQWLAGSCVKCPSSATVALTFVIIGVVICGYLVQAMSKHSHSPSRSELKLFVMWLQSLALFSRVSDKWPAPLVRLLSLLNVFVCIQLFTFTNFVIQNLNADVLNMSCFFRTQFWTMYKIQVFFPFILLGLILLIACVIYFYVRIRQGDIFSQHKIPNPFEKGLSVYIFLLTSLFVFQLSVTFAPFRCFPQIDGTHTLIPNPQENCFDEEWKRNSAVIAFAMLEVISIPCFLGALLFRYRNNMQSNFFEWRYSVLTKSYRPEYYWWEIFTMLRKSALVMIIDLTNGVSPYFRGYVIVMFLVVSMGIDSTCRPYVHQGITVAANFA
jgi:hypothetical protein